MNQLEFGTRREKFLMIRRKSAWEKAKYSARKTPLNPSGGGFLKFRVPKQLFTFSIIVE